MFEQFFSGVGPPFEKHKNIIGRKIIWKIKN